MNACPPVTPVPARCRERGLTLIEILVAVTIAVFLLGGLLTIVGNTQRVFVAQNQMAQLQDNQRLAMTLIGDVIQAAGYFPNPVLYTSTGILPSNATFATAGQSIVGTHNAAAPGDTITVRYATASGDNVINCIGGSNASGANFVYSNAFSIDGLGNLVCALNGAAAVPLVSGLTNLQIWYGVKTSFAVNNGAVDSYLRANEMTAANWSNVITVRVVLTFTNPLAGQPGQAATIPFERVIGVMNHEGVTES